jgi:hypothetical protein
MESKELVAKIGKYYENMLEVEAPQTKKDILQHFLGLIVIYKLHINPDDEKIMKDVGNILSKDYGAATDSDKTEYFRITKEMASHTNDNLAFWNKHTISQSDATKIHLAYCRQLLNFAQTFANFTLTI